MVTSELGACEWFVWDLRRSNLLDRGRLDQPQTLVMEPRLLAGEQIDRIDLAAEERLPELGEVQTRHQNPSRMEVTTLRAKSVATSSMATIS